MRSPIVAALVAIVFTLTACGGGSGGAPISEPGGSPPIDPTPESPPPGPVAAGTEPYTGIALDAYILSKPEAADRPADLIIYDGQENNFAADGASGANQDWQQGKGELFIETQRRGLDRIEAGVAAGDSNLVEEGLKAIEWGLQPSVAGADGSFPEQRDTDEALANALHPKSEFLEAAAHAVIILVQTGAVTPALKDRAAAMLPQVHKIAQRFIDSGDVASFFARAENTNQLAFIATGIYQVGRLANDAAMISTADALMQQILARQWSNGVYPEKNGSDTSYQMVTIELVTTYANLVTDPTWRATLLAANIRAVDWFLSKVRANGSIDISDNTRTTACGPRVQGTGPKGRGVDNVAIRLYYHGYLAGLLPEISPIADQIQLYGQDYDHINTCSGFLGES